MDRKLDLDIVLLRNTGYPLFGRISGIYLNGQQCTNFLKISVLFFSVVEPKLSLLCWSQTFGSALDPAWQNLANPKFVPVLESWDRSDPRFFCLEPVPKFLVGSCYFYGRMVQQ